MTVAQARDRATTHALAPSFAARFGVVMLYAGAMGWLEAVVVVYIRGLLGIAQTETIPPATEVYARLRSLPWLLPPSRRARSRRC